MSRTFVAFADMSKAGIRANLPEIESLASVNESLTVDMSLVVRIDGAGIGALAYLWRRLHTAGHRVTVVNASVPAAELLKELGLAEMLRPSARAPRTTLETPLQTAAGP